MTLPHQDDSAGLDRAGGLARGMPDAMREAAATRFERAAIVTPGKPIIVS
ncbi:hypothetical protein [Solilutibacter pythonis]|nr:hypothetical protein [Lysobacter pythonis]